MDGTTKMFIFLLIVSLILGLLVVLTDPTYRIENIYKTNKNYYPQINDKTLQKGFRELLFETVKK